ncbi:copper resistance CopC family protein [Glutamicibacter arilaitensis]|uniref:copper resistance CopC family protein n=1 Tax=Glutamicibacter arilaitensis TaxID=256701 RepID=UPI003F9A0F1A
MSTGKTATRLIAVFALSLLALFTSISAASAHDQLIGSSPKAGATIEEAPKEITLEFSGELQSLSGVDATVIALTQDGQQVQTEAETKGTKVIVTPSEELAGGKYSLAYRVVSSDGHPIENKINFTLDAPTMVTASPEASQSPATQDSNAPLQDLGSSVSPIVWVIIGLIILGGAIGVLAKFMRNSK